MPAALLFLLALLAAIPPLTETDRARLEFARAGGDHRDEAFAALVEHAETWTTGLEDVGAEPIRLEPDLDALRGAARGALCRVAGVLSQRTALGPPYDHVAEWFVRDEAGTPVIVYVVGPTEGAGLTDGEAVEIAARVYKPIEATDRAGTPRTYPAFVGARPRAAASAAANAVPPLPWLLVAPVAAMFMIFLALLIAGKRGDRRRPVLRAAPPAPEPERGPPLPDDPDEALHELRRRADGGADAG